MRMGTPHKRNLVSYPALVGMSGYYRVISVFFTLQLFVVSIQLSNISRIALKRVIDGSVTNIARTGHLFFVGL